VSIRVACPGCLAALSYPDKAGGKIRSCPKCEADFLIPFPSEHATPLPEPASDHTLIPSNDPRPTPRPIYKQSKLSEESRTSKRRSGDRHRTRVKVRKKENAAINPVYLAVGGIAGVVLIGIVAAIGWQMAGDGKPNVTKPATELTREENTELPPTPISTLIDQPPGWSINEAKLGFRALWPIPGDSNNLGYTPASTFAIGYDGTTPNNWSYAKRDESFAWSVTVIDLLNAGTTDVETSLDRYVDKIKQRTGLSDSEKFRSAKLEVNGLPAREIVTVSASERTISRAMIVNSRLWTWTVICPDATPADDGRIVRFLNSFRVL
jgi:hypothetical protein